MTHIYSLEPIGFVVGGRTTPIDDEWGDVQSSIELAPHIPTAAIAGLEEFSHIDVVFVFHLVDERTIRLDSRRPRGNPAWPEIGIFAQRAKARPNRLGVTTCELIGVDGRALHVRGLDAIDGSPVVDIKPHMAEFSARSAVHQPEWSHELMARYWDSSSSAGD